MLQPLMLTARVRQAGLETPGSKRDQGWADWAARWGSRGAPPSPVPKGSGTPAVRQDEMQGMGRGRTLQSRPQEPTADSLTLPRPSVSKLLQYLGHQGTHEPSEVLPAGLR